MLSSSKPIRSIAVIDLGDFSGPGARLTAARFAQRKLGGQPLIIRMARRLSECAKWMKFSSLARTSPRRC